MARRPARVRFIILFLKYWLPVLVYVTAIFVLSAQPYLKPPIRFPNADKFYHLGEYLLLGWLLARAFRVSLRVPYPVMAAMMALAFGVLVGASDEFFQSFVPGRTCDIFDLLADTAGLVLAQMLFVALTHE